MFFIGLIIFLTFIASLYFPLKVHKNNTLGNLDKKNTLGNLMHSYIISLLLFFYVIFTNYMLFRIEYDFSISILFILISLFFFPYFFKTIIGYSLHKETKTFIYVPLLSLVFSVNSIVYFDIIYVVPFLIIFDFILRKTYEYFKQKSTPK